MKRILPLIEQYHVQQREYAKKKNNNIEILKDQIEEAKGLLNNFRFNIRSTKFKDHSEEIQFFKYIKPSIYADFMFYTNKLKFQVSKPNATNAILKNYLKNELKRLESQKRKNLDFYTYYKHNSSFLDHIYFLRENKQLEIFSTDLSAYLDTEFYTSHDTLAAEVLAYDLLTEFYKKEIKKIKKIESGVFGENKSKPKGSLKWTASKTDFIELMYALKASGAVNFGNINTKDLIITMSDYFDLDINNHYKTYSEIKNRSIDRTKFLNKLKNTLQEKLDFDDGI